MRARVVFAIVVAVIVFTGGVAAAKGPARGEVTGDGLAAPIPIGFGEGTAPGDDLIMQTGFFAAVFGQEPDPMLTARPEGDLGPKLTIVWRMSPGDSTPLKQDVYPYADGGPVTYMAPGQHFFTDGSTVGGWFRAPTTLLTSLQHLGVPARAVLLANAPKPPPAPRAAPDNQARSTDVPWLPIGASLAVVIGASAAVVLVRRHQAMVLRTG